MPEEFQAHHVEVLEEAACLQKDQQIAYPAGETISNILVLDESMSVSPSALRQTGISAKPALH